jgi:glutathione S-transferase
MSSTLNILKPSVNNMTVRIFVRAAGIDVEEVDVWGTTTSPEYVEKYPAHLTPMLEEDDLVRGALGESCAIMAYLCNKHGLDRFYPPDPAERAVIDNAMFYLIGTLYPLLTRATYPALGFPQYPGEVGTSEADEAMKDKAVEEATAALADPLEVYGASSSATSSSSGATRPRLRTSASPRRSSSCARSTTSSRPGPRSTCSGWSRRSATRTRSRPRTSADTSSTCGPRARRERRAARRPRTAEPA